MDANSCTESPVLSTIIGNKTKSACGTAVLCLIDAEVTDPVVPLCDEVRKRPPMRSSVRVVFASDTTFALNH